MKNLGIFFPIAVGIEDLVNHGADLGGERIDEMTMRFGNIPEEAYLNLSTDLSDGCFDEEEFESLRLDLGFPPASYVSIHMNYSRSAFLQALAIARSIEARWRGKIDFSGTGGIVDSSQATETPFS